MIRVRLLDGPAEMLAAERLLSRVWGGGAVQLDAATMRAFSHTGNYVAGAYRSEGDSEDLVGCAVGFFGPPDQRSLHSHIAGVDPDHAGRGIGLILKNHQRSWCLDQGVGSITWTFDPAIARNAFFNFGKLGVTAVSYLEDFYGSLDDSLNLGSPSDRLLLRWDLTDPPPRPGPAGGQPLAHALALDAHGAPVVRPIEPDVDAVLISVPPDIERLRREDAELAARWRFALREVLAPYVNSEEWRVAGFMKQGTYVMERSR
ncbi:MAG: GNAT family N-acetyltransferase [Propionibacteriaceae bacterium]